MYQALSKYHLCTAYILSPYRMEKAILSTEKMNLETISSSNIRSTCTYTPIKLVDSVFTIAFTISRPQLKQLGREDTKSPCREERNSPLIQTAPHTQALRYLETLPIIWRRIGRWTHRLLLLLAWHTRLIWLSWTRLLMHSSWLLLLVARSNGYGQFRILEWRNAIFFCEGFHSVYCRAYILTLPGGLPCPSSCCSWSGSS